MTAQQRMAISLALLAAIAFLLARLFPPDKEAPRPAAVRQVLTRPEEAAGGEGEAFSAESLQAAMEAIVPDAARCLEPSSGALLEMTLGPDGIEEAALVSGGLSEDALRCLSGVVYGADWPLPAESTDVSWPLGT